MLKTQLNYLKRPQNGNDEAGYLKVCTVPLTELVQSIAQTYLHVEGGREVKGAGLRGSVMPDVDGEAGRLTELAQQPEQHRVLGARSEHHDHIAVRRRDALQPKTFGGQEVAGARDLFLQQFGSCDT